jgi:hypothetical protein
MFFIFAEKEFCAKLSKLPHPKNWRCFLTTAMLETERMAKSGTSHTIRP